MAAAGVPHRAVGDRRQPGPPRRRARPLHRRPTSSRTTAWPPGKGVVVTDDLDAARAHAMRLLDGGHPVLLESYLDGPEVSLFCLVDGADRGAAAARAGLQAGRRRRHRPQHRRHGRLRAAALGAAGAGRRRRRADRGAGRGGAGGARHAVLRPALRRAGADLDRARRSSSSTAASATPRPRSSSPLLRTPLAGAAARRRRRARSPQQPPLEWGDGAAVTVVVAAEGYPGTPRLATSSPARRREGVLHAGTRRRDDGAVVSAGGRVLSVVGTGAGPRRGPRRRLPAAGGRAARGLAPPHRHRAARGQRESHGPVGGVTGQSGSGAALLHVLDVVEVAR